MPTNPIDDPHADPAVADVSTTGDPAPTGDGDDAAPTPTTSVAPLLGVTELGIGLGSHRGNRFVLLSLERWEGWVDLRFARIADPGAAPLPRRVPPAEAWLVRDDLGTTYDVVDVTGRGDRAFSHGEVRLRPAMSLAVTELTVAVLPAPEADALAMTFSAL